MAIEYHDPRAPQDTPSQPYEIEADLSGPLTVGLLANGFPDSARFLEHLGAALAPKLPRAGFRHYLKPVDSAVVPEEMLAAIEAECAALVCAYGHCGSCTSSTVRDSIVAARRGIPAVSFVTEAFWEQGNFVARADGMPTVPRIKLPYPVAGTGDGALKSLADRVADEVIARLERG